MYLGSHHRVNQPAYEEEDSDSDDDVIDVLSADHCTGEHSYTMQMPTSMVLQARKAAQRRAAEEVPNLIPELQSGYRLVQYLTSPACQKYSGSFMKPFDTEQKEYKSYNKVITNPMWFEKVKEGLDNNAYATITEVVRDIRLILENCYRFFGPSHSFSKRAMKLETILEQKLALLPRELREKTSIETTTLNGLDHTTFKGRRSRLSLLSTEMSPLMSYVKSQSTARAREERLKQREERRFEKEVAQQVACDWDQETFQQGLVKIANMWEVPQVCQFLTLAQPILNLPEIAMCEVERMFLMPQQSTLLSTVMTCLLVSPHHRSRVLQKGPMPYRIWQDRLNTRLAIWYKTYHSSRRNTNKVFEVHGVEEQFFQVLGDTSPLETKSFHELEVVQRVWLVKSLCDYKLQHHKIVQDHFAEQDADGMRETVLGEDAAGQSYLYFPILSLRDLRVYRRGKLDPTEYEFEPPVKRPPPRRTSRKSKRRRGGTEASVAEGNPSKRSARLRRVIKPSLRHSQRREAASTQSAATEEEEKKGKEEETKKEEAVEEDPPAAEEESKEPSFATVATSVAELRSLITSLEQKMTGGNEPVSTRSKAKREDGPSSGERAGGQLMVELQALLSEMEQWESRFQQTEAAVRLKLYKEWHAFASKTDDDQEDGGSQHEEAWNAWTVRYRDEDDGVYNDSEDDEEEEAATAADEEYREESRAAAVGDIPDDGNTVRVLRKRKIVLPNGDFEWPSWGPRESPEPFSATPEMSSEPGTESDGAPRFDPGRQKCDATSGPLPGRSDPEIPPEREGTRTTNQCVALQTVAEPVSSKATESNAEAGAKAADLESEGRSPTERPVRTGRKVLADHLTKMFANAVPRSLFPKRVYSRPVKINALLAARLRDQAKTNPTRDALPSLPHGVPIEKPKEEVRPVPATREVVRLSTVREAVPKRVVDVTPERREKQTIRKMTLVPATDKGGQNTFLRVEYARSPSAVARPASKPTEAVTSEQTPLPPPQVPRFYTSSPLKYGISNRAQEVPAEKPRQENRRPTILKVRADAPRTFNLPWWKKNGITVSTHAREVPGEKKFFRSKNTTDCNTAEVNSTARNDVPGCVEDPGSTVQRGDTGEDRFANSTARQVVANGPVDHCGTAVQQGVSDRQDFATQQPCVAVPPQVLCDQNVIAPLQNFGGFPSENGATQVMYLLPEVVNSLATAQQQTMMVDPSTFLNPPPDPGPVPEAAVMAAATPDRVPQFTDPYAMQAPEGQVLQSAADSCLLSAGPDALRSVVQQQLPQDSAVQQQPVYLLTSDGHLLQIVTSS